MDSNQLPPAAGQAPLPPIPPAPSTPNSGGSFNPGQYDFITNPTKPTKKTLLPSAGSSKKQRILFAVIGFLILITVGVVFYSLLTGSSKSDYEQLVTVLQTQTEVLRIADYGANKAGGDSAKNIAAKTRSVVASHELQLQAAMTSRKMKKVTSKDLAKGHDIKTDQTLTSAQQNGRFDDAFIQTIRADLETYQKNLKAAYDSSSSKGIKELLNQDYQQTNLLLEDITGQSQ